MSSLAFLVLLIYYEYGGEVEHLGRCELNTGRADKKLDYFLISFLRCSYKSCSDHS